MSILLTAEEIKALATKINQELFHPSVKHPIDKQAIAEKAVMVIAKAVAKKIIARVLKVLEGVHSNTCESREGLECDCRVGKLRQALKKEIEDAG